MKQQFGENLRIHGPLKESAQKHKAMGTAQAEAIKSALSARNRAALQQRESIGKRAGQYLLQLGSMLLAGFLAYVIMAIVVSGLYPLVNSINAPLVGNMLLSVGAAIVGAFLGGLIVGWLFPQHARWGIVVIFACLFLTRLVPEFARILQDINHPRLFWLPFLTTSLYTVLMPVAQLLGAAVGKQYRRKDARPNLREGGRQNVEEAATTGQETGFPVPIDAVRQ